MKKLILVTATIIFLLTVYSFHKTPLTVTVTGEVFVNSQPLGTVKVQVIEKPNYWESSKLDGSYQLKFNTEESNPTHIYYYKKGYTTFRQSFIQSGTNAVSQLPDVHLLKLSNTQHNSFVTPSTIKVYKSQNIENFELVAIDQFEYFELILKKTPVSNSIPQENQTLDIQSTPHWFLVRFKTKDVNGLQKGWLIQ